VELFGQVLADRDDRHGGRVDTGEAEQVAKPQVLQATVVARQRVDIQLQPLELPSIQQGSDREAQPSLIGFGGQVSRRGDLEGEAILQVGVDRLLHDVIEHLE
jgi:hypothetical protein